VPDGTPGKVLLVSGVTWIRYRVLFENGVEQGLLDGRHIRAREDWLPAEERVEEEVVAEVAASDDDGAAASAAADNEFGVPAPLLEPCGAVGHPVPARRPPAVH
jgi:hypothetical protein